MKNIQHIVTGQSHEGIEQINIPEKRGGFFDLPKEKTCKHPEHKPPMHIYIPQGKGYRHVCPACGDESVIIPQQIYLDSNKNPLHVEYLKCQHGIDQRQSCSLCDSLKSSYFKSAITADKEPPKRIPILRGCNAQGGCRDIIGYRDPLYPGER